MQLAHFTRERDDADAGEAHPLVETGNVFLIARKPVERFREDHVEAALQSIGYQFLRTGAQQRRTGNRPVRVAVSNGPALMFGANAANAKLVLNRCVALLSKE